MKASYFSFLFAAIICSFIVLNVQSEPFFKKYIPFTQSSSFFEKCKQYASPIKNNFDNTSSEDSFANRYIKTVARRWADNIPVIAHSLKHFNSSIQSSLKSTMRRVPFACINSFLLRWSIDIVNK